MIEPAAVKAVGALEDQAAQHSTQEPALARSLSARHVAMIAIGGIIGAGLFVGSSTAIATAGPAVVVSYLLAGLIVLLVMRMISEMAMAVPGRQSFADFARLELGNWAGFMSGWLYWYFWVVVVAIEAVAGAAIINQWLPGFAIWEIGVVLMAALTGVNLMSARAYGEFEFWFSTLKVIAILVFIVVTASYAMGFGAPSGSTFGNLVDHGGFAPHGWGAVIAGVTSVIFSLTGAEIATIAAAESNAGERTIARMGASVALRILIFYILSIILIVSVVPWDSIEPGYSPFASAMAVVGIPHAETIANLVVLIAVLSCLNSGLYVTSRVVFSLAAHREAPAALARINARGVPTRAILLGSLFSYGALAASVLSPAVVFSFLVNASGVIMIALYLMVAVAQLRLRARFERDAPEKLKLRMWFHPWGSLFAILAMIGVIVAMAITPGLAIQLYTSLFTIAVVGLAYLAVNARRSVADPSTPISESERPS
ncbi:MULTISPECIES: amino acid permease [unclassified Sphingopyxis]|uniref:amino acid permease n=1 Tax=unclassified Sphingopyxis TaxID=2614943 RepID=UPI0009ECB495|nr:MULTISPECIES: amino acid permease [unclassified Sphingopyxis]